MTTEHPVPYICIVTVIIISPIDEGLIGMLYSVERNVGKSSTLQILAKGQGIHVNGIVAHPLLCSGGDQTISGVSM